MIDFREIRTRFLEFFRSKDHAIVPSSSLVPHDDPTLLFTNAGMVQFKKLFLGQEKRSYTRATSSQKCVRAGGKHNDLENVGYTHRHHTFFEMLGNFSFGDYFKREAISWAWELLTVHYRLPKERLWISVYEKDDEAYEIWEKDIGIPSERIVRLGEKDNFWAMGETGPCGPCSEILFDQGEELSCGRPDCGPECDCDRYLEIWNLVFTQFNRSPDGTLTPLPRPNIDTGMGLERICAVIQGVTSNYDTDLFKGLIGAIEDLSGISYGSGQKEDVAIRVIADHSRAVAFLISDGVLPSNEGRGYVLRRIIRRAIRFGQRLGLKENFLYLISEKVCDIMGKDYKELLDARSLIKEVVISEENRFRDTLFYGIRILEEEIEKLKARGSSLIPGDVAFRIYDTYGLSVDLVQDVAREEGMEVDLTGYKAAMEERRAISQSSWKGSGQKEIPPYLASLEAEGMEPEFLGYETLKCSSRVIAIFVDGERIDTIHEGQDAEIILDKTPFYGEAGGQVGDTGRLIGQKGTFRVRDTQRHGSSIIVHKGKMEYGTISLDEEIISEVDRGRRYSISRNHTATHLLHAALREILGDHVKQSGSLVAPDRLRFDFSHFSKVHLDTLREIEDRVNTHIMENHPVEVEVMPREEAFKSGAIAIFEERYGDEVRVVTIGDGISKELCGGTHVKRTGDIGTFKIVSESAVGANLRRIEALTGHNAVKFMQELETELNEIAEMLKTSPQELKGRISQLLKERKERDREIERLRKRLLKEGVDKLFSETRKIDGIRVYVQEMEAESPRELRELGDQLKLKYKDSIILIGSKTQDKVMLLCLVTGKLQDSLNASEIIREVSEIVGGKGGGRADMAQGGGSLTEKFRDALTGVFSIVEKRLRDS